MPRNCFGDLRGVKSCWGYKLKLDQSQQDSKTNDTLVKNARTFSLKELEKATKNFTTNLGTGGFPSSYKGTLENGSLVEIKVLRNQKAVADLRQDLNMMSMIRHRNVAQLIGYCLEGDRFIVVYDYIGDYKLDQLLFNRDIKEKGPPLSWPVRASICIGIARGLEYLHEGASHRVVHRDIKLSNIRLDENFNPKIVDFTLAKWSNDDLSDFSGDIDGTMGYIDPNFLLTGRYTAKADVYSFGILLLEIISGRRVVDFRREGNGMGSLVDWARELQETGRVLDFIDPSLTNFPEDEVKRYVDVALSCAQTSENLRPSMSEALLMLLGGYDFDKKVLRNPKHAVRTRSHHEDYYSSHDEKSDEVEVTIPQSDASSPIHVSTRMSRKQDLAVGSTFRRASTQPATESMSKMARDFETEIESDLDSHSSSSEILEIQHDGEIEVYRSIEDITSAAPLSGPSDNSTVKHELVSPSLNSRIPNPPSLSTDDNYVHEEGVDATQQAQMSQAVKRSQMSQDQEDELQLSEISQSTSLIDRTTGKTGVRATSSTDNDTFVHNEAANSFPCLAETSEIKEIISLFEVDVEMEVLSDAAWVLFRRQVGNVIESPDIYPYARALYKDCHGSDVIISALGSALRGESSVDEWKAALSTLQFKQYKRQDEVYLYRRHIRYCYNRLKARDVKYGFLYCSLFEQDKEIDILMLVECFMNEGLVGGTTVAAYRRGHDIVRCLINASLLEANHNGMMVKMHNIIRESALEILLSNYRVLVGLPLLEKDEDQSFQGSHWHGTCNFMTRAGAHLKDSPSVEEWERTAIISLMDNEVSTLPSKPNCFALVALFLQRNSSLRVIPASFFNSMSNLKLLNLSKTRIRSLPDSFSSLTSLQILLLCYCERMTSLPLSIGLLKSLEVLDLQGTEIIHLPHSVGALESLKQLRVSFYGTMNLREHKKLPAKLVSDGILIKLGLTELGMFVYPGDQRWTSSASSIIKEICYLKLSVLHFHFPKIEDLESFVHDSQSWINEDIIAFKFIVGPDFKRVVSLVSNDAQLLYNESQQCLRYVNEESIPSVVLEVLTRATSFHLDHHLKISYLSQFGIHCFKGLKICILSDCPEIVSLVDKYERGCFPCLEYLSINHLWNLKGIWGCHIGTGSFTRLRYLSICACPKLSYVLTCNMVGMLSNLEELIIKDCVSLKYVIAKDDDAHAPSEGVGMTHEEVTARERPTLCNLKVLKLHYLPEISGIWTTAQWPPLEYMSFYNCPGLRNLHMKGNEDLHIKEIAADMSWWDSLEWDDPLLSRKLDTVVTQIHVDDL